MLFSWVIISILIDVAFIIFFDMIKRLITAIRNKVGQSATVLKGIGSHVRKVPTKDAETSSEPKSAPKLDYLDVAVQVNESMLPQEDREFPLIMSIGKESLDCKAGKVAIHGDNRRPEFIHEERSDCGRSILEERTTSSSSVSPKPALKGSSRKGSSAKSLDSSKTGSDSGSSGGKKVSWEQGSVRSERDCDEKLAYSTSGARTATQGRKSIDTQDKNIGTEVSAKVLELVPVADRTAFETFRKLCANNHLLDRPRGLSKGDLQDGVNDDTTLLSVNSQVTAPIVLRHTSPFYLVNFCIAVSSPHASAISAKPITSSKTLT